MSRFITGMVKYHKSLVYSVVLMLVFAIPLNPTVQSTRAATTTDLQKQLEQTRQQQQAVEQQRKQKQDEAAKLNTLIKQLNDNITRASAALKDTGNKLTQTGKDIADATTALKQEEEKLAQLKMQLEAIIRELYQESSTESPVLEFFSSASISDGVTHAEYHSSINTELEKSVNEEEQARQKVTETKTNLEQKQNQLQQLKDQQVATKKGLDSEQARKNKALTDAIGAIADLKQQEADLADREQAVEDQIQALLNARKNGTLVGGINVPVKKGDVIGYQGNTGFSTGSHLHFSVFPTCDITQSANPNNYLDKTLSWPLDDYYISQDYGMTSFARAGAYRGKIHNGLDLVQYYGAPIRAAADGTIILRQAFGGYGNAAIIQHSDGSCTLYGHMSS